MKLLLLGADGQVGWELRRSLETCGELIACTRQDADFQYVDSVAGLLDTVSPDVVVNAAAYTAVDKAEQEPDRARLVNTDAVDLLAKYASSSGALLVHYSTDYVFDGTKAGAYDESDVPNPLSVYGQTKLDGEVAIQESGCRHLIFRTSWVYSVRGANFLKTISRLAANRDQLNIVSDQTGVPTSAEMIADATAAAIAMEILNCEEKGSYSGLYHLTPNGQTSWYELAKYYLERCSGAGSRARLNPVTTDQYPTSAARPLNSLLDCSKFVGTFGYSLPDWRFHVDRMIATMSPQEAE